MMIFPLRLIKHNTEFHFIKRRYVVFTLSALITIASIFGMFKPGLNLGIDFTGGVIIEISNQQHNLSPDAIRQFIDNLGYTGIAIQSDEKNNVMIRLQIKHESDYAKDIENIKTQLKRHLNQIEFRKIEYVGPKIGKKLIRDGIIAVLASLAAMMLYITARFHWKSGIGILVALVHDVTATIGFYLVSQSAFDLTSIAAILTIIGYSVNDSVVIHDRIRDNLRKYQQKPIAELIDLSINETLSRTIMTVATTLVVCTSLIIFGGPSLRGIGMAIFFGIVFGTYSSIYISAPLLLLFQGKENRPIRNSISISK